MNTKCSLLFRPQRLSAMQVPRIARINVQRYKVSSKIQHWCIIILMHRYDMPGACRRVEATTTTGSSSGTRPARSVYQGRQQLIISGIKSCCEYYDVSLLLLYKVVYYTYE